MKRIILIVPFILLILTRFGFGQTSFQKNWDQKYGAYIQDYSRSNPIQDADGNFIFLVTSSGGPGGEYTISSYGGWDYWIFKVDSLGNLLSMFRFGGSSQEYGQKLISLPDGGYLIAGESSSPVSGNKTEALRGGTDMWVVRTDSSFNILWDKTLGGTSNETCVDAIITPDNGFILVGTTKSLQGMDVSQPGFNGPSQSKEDYWVVRIDSIGNKIWDKRYGGIEDEIAYSIIESGDGNYLISGTTRSSNGGMITQTSRGDQDFWVLKIDPSGNKIWDKRYGSPGSTDMAESPYLQLTSGGGFIIAGTSDGEVGYEKSAPRKGVVDFWVLKCDSLGTKLWDRTFGGDKNEYLNVFNKLSDGNYLLGGASYSQNNGDKTQANWAVSIANMWIVKFNPAGQKIWDVRWGAIKGENCTGILELNNGGFLATGSSVSHLSGDKSQNNWQLTPTSNIAVNVWAIKFSSSTVGFNEFDKSGIFIYPNPVNSELHIRNNTGNFSEAKFKIFDSLGRTFYELAVSNQLEELTIDLTNLAPGIYFIQGEEAEKNWVGKFIKSN